MTLFHKQKRTLNKQKDHCLRYMARVPRTDSFIKTSITVAMCVYVKIKSCYQNKSFTFPQLSGHNFVTLVISSLVNL